MGRINDYKKMRFSLVPGRDAGDSGPRSGSVAAQAATEDVSVLRGLRLTFLAATMILARLLGVPRNSSGLFLGTRPGVSFG